MSELEFMNRLRLVVSMIPPAEFTSDGHADTPDGIRQHEKALASADVWLDPAFTADTAATESWFPDPYDRQRVSDHLARLTRLSEQVARGEPPTPQQQEAGLSELMVLDVFLPSRDGFQKELVQFLWDKIEPKYPDLAYGFDASFGSDWSGDPAVKIKVVVPGEDVLSHPAFDAFKHDLDRAARAWLDARQLPHWPYTRLLTPADIKDQLAGVEA